MKYILKKDLPLAKAGTEVFVKTDDSPIAIMYSPVSTLGEIERKNIPEWLEEVKEPKTIYDLKEGDEYWILYTYDNPMQIRKATLQSSFSPNANFQCFCTEREAKRNKLLRELAARTDKWLPEEDVQYTCPHREKSATWRWEEDNLDVIYYHMGLVFRNEEEYNKYITEEARDLLFNL